MGLPKLPMDQALDTLAIARKRFPGSPATLDALCRRFNIDNANRTLHGALLDAEILADVYLMMTGGQTDLMFSAGMDEASSEGPTINSSELESIDSRSLSVIKATGEEMIAHDGILDLLDKKSDGAIWRR